MGRKDEKKIGDLLQNMIKKDKQLEQKVLDQRLQDAWNAIASPMIQKYTYKVFYHKRKLYLKLSSSVLRHELNIGKQKLVKNMNEELGEELIDEVVLLSEAEIAAGAVLVESGG